jgi:phosphatidylglycerophosphate synthase
MPPLLTHSLILTVLFLTIFALFTFHMLVWNFVFPNYNLFCLIIDGFDGLYGIHVHV